MEKTLVFFLFILLGFLLKKKLQSKEETLGIKKIILNLALPATIFMALLSIEVKPHLLLLPLLSLLFNGLLFFSSPSLSRLAGLKKGSSEMRTAQMLLPSLAPGLSCFPFVIEFLGKDGLAKVAMADLGNKVFVLFVLYTVAMAWHNKRSLQPKQKVQLKQLLKRFFGEPVNLFISAALLLLIAGVQFENLPFVIQDSLSRLGALMTPLVLLFIGLSVKIKREQFRTLFSLLLYRAAFAFFAVGLFSLLSGLSGGPDYLLLLAFSLSACSFWPFAHITSIDQLEVNRKTTAQTFCPGFAINLLALSFPMSTVLIMGTLNSGTLFYNPFLIILAGLILAFLGLVFSPHPIFNGLSIFKKERLSGLLLGLYTNNKTKVNKKPATAK